MSCHCPACVGDVTFGMQGCHYAHQPLKHYSTITPCQEAATNLAFAGRHAPAVPRSKRLLSDAGSNVLVYLAGHGGDDFMKFQDQEEIMGQVGSLPEAQCPTVHLWKDHQEPSCAGRLTIAQSTMRRLP
jgi:hypothetical protein